MKSASHYGMLMTTAPSREAASRIANMLVEEKLAACVQLLPIESFYCWEQKTQNEPELLVLIKTRTALFEKIITRIKEAHPYSVPEIVATSFVAAFEGYLDWIDDVTDDSSARLRSDQKPPGGNP